MNGILIALCVCGLMLHFLGRWGEFRKTGEKIGPIAYFQQDVPGWLFAFVATCVCMLMLPELPKLFGLSLALNNSGLMKFCALLAGYCGSSIAAKVPAYFSGRGIR